MLPTTDQNFLGILVNLGISLSVPLVTITSNHFHKLGRLTTVITCVCVLTWLYRESGFTYITLQIGFMNNGVIKAADVEYYINGGCTPDESESVRNMPFPEATS